MFGNRSCSKQELKIVLLQWPLEFSIISTAVLIWGMSGAGLGHHLGHHLGHVWGIIWGMSGAPYGACLGQSKISAVLHAQSHFV